MTQPAAIYSGKGNFILRISQPIVDITGFAILFLCLVFPIQAFSQSQASLPSASPELEITLKTEGPMPEHVVAQRPFEWRIIIRWHGDSTAIQPFIKKEPSFDQLEVIEPSTTLKTGHDDIGRYTEMRFNYKLMPEVEGEARIGSTAIAYQTGEDEDDLAYLTTPSTTINVGKAPFDWGEFFQGMVTSLFFWVTVIFLLIIIAVTIFIRRRSHSSQTQTDEDTTADPLDEMLEHAHRDRVEGDMSGYIRHLEQAVKYHLDQRFPQYHQAQLSGYIDEVDSELKPVLKRFLHTGEECKYAPDRPSPDVWDQLWNDTKRLTQI